tara:strand:+ start:2120 stop:2437 length:318 start_codon:yes stop_codon:yes gene_type:complete
MTKDKWKEIYRIFENTYNDFQMEYPNSINGKNEKIRNSSRRSVANSIQIVSTWMKIHPELMTVFVGNNTNPNAIAFAYDEFLQPRYFQKDMPEYLNRIKAHINSL